MLYRDTQLLGLNLIVFLAACAGIQPSPQSQPQSPSVSGSVTSAAETSPRQWHFIRENSPISYSSTVTTVLALLTDSLASQDTIQLNTDFQVQFTDNFPANLKTPAVSGIIERLSIRPGHRAGEPDTLIPVPFHFAGTIQNGNFIPDSAAGQPISVLASCTTRISVIVPILHRNIIMPPSTISTESSWGDSTTISACSGSIPIVLTTIRRYRVIGETSLDQKPMILIERQDRSSVAGEGAQGQHHITLGSHGSGTAKLYIERLTGHLTASQTEQRTEISITSSGRTQVFIQRIHELTERRKAN